MNCQGNGGGCSGGTGGGGGCGSGGHGNDDAGEVSPGSLFTSEVNHCAFLQSSGFLSEKGCGHMFPSSQYLYSYC